MQPDYRLLLSKIQALEEWKAERERQQIKYPLDKISYDIIGQGNQPVRIGGIYMTILPENPGASLGYGTWIVFGNNAVPVGINSGTGGGLQPRTATVGGSTIITTINVYMWLRTS